ncbi:radical SAM protein [Enterococcus thailandicus]|uniref:Radical SAM/SPASM domain-containing protein n=1 Tax=Enterococcus thailandicus TaxID=417368 RepID=A0A510WEH6_ENTTH|nr:radical SAM protein [Enterococcus thailandicus]OJG93937.1 radical SAM additional 4Fe4S-binding SPASM domain-containing protein [Enterococcus thailandicus]GEK37337.1 radical SAM/SPASM domain-containing protein [Enterococcus thailandicus]
MKENNFRNDFYFLENEDSDILLHIPSSSIFQITDNELSKKMRDFFISQNSQSAVNQILRDISNEKEEKFNCLDCNSLKQISTEAKDFSIGKLSLVLTSDCNLRCEYCYANFGMYDYEKRSNFTKEKLYDGLNYLVSNFKEIKVIQFFGGEPSLCTKQIEFVVNFFAQKKKEGNISKLPIFGIVTNCVILPQKLLQIYKQYDFAITISLDGPQEINDRLRYDIREKGHYKDIVNNYQLLIESGIKNIGFECTYTNEHINRGISYSDLARFFFETFGSQATHIVPVNIDIDNELSVLKNVDKYREYVRDIVNLTFAQVTTGEKVTSISLVLGILFRLINQIQEPRICPAGIQTFSLSHDNQLSPCFMYTSQDETAYGYVGEDPNEIVKKAISFDNQVNNKLKSNDCMICPARTVCSSCLGGFVINKDNIELTNPVFCQTINEILKQSLINIGLLKSNPEAWSSFQSNLRRAI